MGRALRAVCGRPLLGPTEADFIQLLGKDEYASLGKPLRYRFPLGLTILVGIIGGCVTWKRVFPSKEARLRQLVQDPHFPNYQQAARLFEEKIAAAPCHDENAHSAAIDAAVAFLGEQGIPPKRAKARLLLLLEAQRYEQVLQQEQLTAALLNNAAQFEQNGEWAQALEVYEYLARQVQGTKQEEYVQNRIRDVREKQAGASS
jgi:hypothetical protein